MTENPVRTFIVQTDDGVRREIKLSIGPATDPAAFIQQYFDEQRCNGRRRMIVVEIQELTPVAAPEHIVHISVLPRAVPAALAQSEQTASFPERVIAFLSHHTTIQAAALAVSILLIAVLQGCLEHHT